MAVKGERVVLRGVQVIVLDDLAPNERREALTAITGMSDSLAHREAWVVEAMASGSFDAAVEAFAGKSGESMDNKPGRYRAVKKAAWLEKGPRVIEPPIT
jgi:hypothetical protein